MSMKASSLRWVQTVCLSVAKVAKQVVQDTGKLVICWLKAACMSVVGVKSKKAKQQASCKSQDVASKSRNR